MTAVDPVAVDRDALAEWLGTQRWFAGKGREVTLARLVPIPICDDPSVALAIAELAAADGAEPERYQLLVSDTPAAGVAPVDSVATDPDAAVPDIVGATGSGPAPTDRAPAAAATRAPHDALAEPEAAAALVDRLRHPGTAAGPGATVSFHWADGHPPPPDGVVRPIGAEQSNSSVVIGDALVLKVFRRLRPGVNPELEMSRFLTAAGYPHVPALAGWYDADLDGEPLTLGVAQDLVADGRDGWDHVLDGLQTDPGSLLGPLRRLGAVVAGLHDALGAAPAGDPAFAPQPCDSAAVQAMAGQVAADARSVLGALASSGPGAGLRDRVDEAVAAAHALAADLSGGRLIRHHGDLHLGQTLHTPHGWVLLDFEGEPARDLEQRRARHTPLRDVAGLLRSFAYATATADRSTGLGAPHGWEAAARSALLDGYLAAVDPALLPASALATRRLLALMELEKVIYEIGYEVGHRPDWVDIPATSLHRLLDGAPR
ncbi:MAG: hypothetical protein JWM05_2150 [Acidimicrobiales bacterium]|nr:hypothetical protein [Acidimicrobiales bacterium]